MASLAKSVWPSSQASRRAESLLPTTRKPLDQLPHPSRRLLGEVLRLNLVSHEWADCFLEARADRLGEYASEVELGAALVAAQLLTRYQLERLLAGSTHGLVLGNYRVLDQIGAGGMGLVYLAEHCLMRRRVAVKVLPIDDDCDDSLKQRFYAEMRLLAELNHPNIVKAFDAGELAAPGPNMPALSYLVMEFVPGGNLDEYVERHGPMLVTTACDFIRQAAQGLQAAHDLHVIHRDVKPSNLLLTEDGRVKLVDFGLARQFCSQLTDPRALLGSVEFMAPEQSHDASGVGPEADVYGLGATLFWMLCGEAPHPFHRNVGSALRALQNEPPRRLRALLPNASPELDNLIASMLQRDPLRRPTPLAVGLALAPFVAARLDRPEALVEHYRLANCQLERSLEVSRNDLREAHDALLFAMARMAESRDGETAGHLRRMQRYVQVLAETAAEEPPWQGLVDERFLKQVVRCVPLHDIGKIGLPDDVLLKPASLSAAERKLVETHPAIGDRILESLGKEHGLALDFLSIARAIVRHHHERYDGRGYPDCVAGDAIPAAARLTAVADVYDALRRDRLHRAALSHSSAVQVMLRQSPGQFDPSLLTAFEKCNSEFERIYREIGD